MKEKIKYFLYVLATDRYKSILFAPLKFILYCLSLIYGQMIKFIISKPKKVAAVVIGVGNITLGGTGKTPLVLYLAKKLKSYGKKTAILTRGYGEDEKFLLREESNNIPVLEGRDRIKNADAAINQYGAEALLLDDSMQQGGIYKDLEILAVDSTNPFGNGHLLPRGILREPICNLKRGHIFLISKLDKGLKALADLRHQLVSINPQALILEASHEPVSLADIFSNQILNLSFIKNSEVVLVSAIGDNQYFEHSVLKLGARVKFHFTFMDHYEYTKNDWLKITEYARDNKIDTILTTSKDMIKLKKIINDHNLFFPQIKLLVLSIELKILKGEELLNERLFSLFNS